LRPIFYPLLAISVFYMLIATATEPRVAIPYENTARDLLLPDYMRARFAQNTDALFDGQRNLAKDSAAFNVGKLMRLPAHLQLIPLLLWWVGMGGAVLITARQSAPAVPDQTGSEPPSSPRGSGALPRAALVGVSVFAVLFAIPPIVH